MNIRRWRVPVLLLSALLLVSALVPATLAFLATESNHITNTFTVDPLTPSAHVPVQIVKTVTGGNITPEGFQFALVDENANIITLTTDENGEAQTVLTLDAAEHTYIYHLYEVNDHRENVQYSTAVYEIRIHTVEKDGRIVPEITVNGQSVNRIVAAFENRYLSAASAPPLTGDSTPLALYAALALISGALACTLMRRRQL